MRALLIKLPMISLSIALIGKGLTQLRNGSPYSALWWDETLMSPLLSTFGYSWVEYADSPMIEHILSIVERGLCWTLITFGMCIVPLLIVSDQQMTDGSSTDHPVRVQLIKKSVLWFLLLLLSFQVMCQSLDQRMQIAVICEGAVFVSLPLLCHSWDLTHRINMGVIALIGTFLGHGWFALNLGARPADFVTMSTSILSLSEANAHVMLVLFGLIDVAVSMLIIPVLFGQCTMSIRRSLIYMSIWGALTAAARLVGHHHLYYDWATLLLAWGPEVLWRLPHGLIPLWIYYMLIDDLSNHRTSHHTPTR